MLKTVSLCHSKTRSSKKCSDCPQQQLSKPARGPHRTSSVAGPNPIQHTKNWKISTLPDPTQPNPTHGQLCCRRSNKCGGDAAFRQNTLTSSYNYNYVMRYFKLIIIYNRPNLSYNSAIIVVIHMRITVASLNQWPDSLTSICWLLC